MATNAKKTAEKETKTTKTAAKAETKTTKTTKTVKAKEPTVNVTIQFQGRDTSVQDIVNTMQAAARTLSSRSTFMFSPRRTAHIL